MNKILNWTFGACFRTLGRFLAIFIVGVLLIFIGSKIGIELPDWLALRVSAAEITVSSWGQKVNYEIYWLDDRGTETLQSNWVTGNFTDFCPNGIVCGLTTNWLYIKLGSSLNSSNTYTINFDEWITTRKTEDFYNNNLTFKLLASNTGGYDGSSSSFVRNLACQAGLQEGTTSKVSFSCSFTPTQSINYLYLRITYDNKNIPFTSFGATKPKITYDNSTTDALNNQTTIIQNQTNTIIQKQEEIKDTITNENTTGAEDSASGFFNDFTTETFGLTSIITAPLNAINSLISSTCSPLVLPLPYVDKNLSLPCMSIIYNQYFGAFFSIYQLITTGLISYYVIVRIFNLVKDFKNPDHDEIEVVDL